jgi:predicted Fe-Mo cluster-binding NifX family protein
MSIAISAKGPGFDSMVDKRFGRCACFVLVGPDGKELESIANPSIGASGGAGIQTAQFMVDKGVNTVLVGNIGPNAIGILKAAGVDVYVGAQGKVSETLELYQQGKLKLVTESTAPRHSGLGGSGGGTGKGLGRGRLQ